MNHYDHYYMIVLIKAFSQLFPKDKMKLRIQDYFFGLIWAFLIFTLAKLHLTNPIK